MPSRGVTTRGDACLAFSRDRDFYQLLSGRVRTAKARARDEHGSDYDTSGDPAYAGVAGMRDLATELVTTVNNAIVHAGEELDS